MQEQTPTPKPVEEPQPRPAIALTWLLLGLAGPLLFLLMVPSSAPQVSLLPLAVYLLSVLGLDLFVGASSALVTSQRVTPAVVLALLLTPGIPPVLALLIDMVGVISVASTSRISYLLLSQAGRSLIPASLTAFYLHTRSGPIIAEIDFFACEIFVVISLLTRTHRPPFRSDVLLVIAYPAVALLLRYLSELHLTYVLLAVPLLFLLTTAEAETMRRYFSLRKTLQESQSQVAQSRRAQRQTEIESRRKGIQLLRKEQQLSLLNGLGQQMEAAQASEDLGRFLLKESIRLTGAESSLLFFSAPDGRVGRILSPAPATGWGLVEGERVPRLTDATIGEREPWPAPLWRGKQSFLVCSLGEQGWMVLARAEKDSFPPFLAEFFSAVGRHAGSAILALRRLSEVRAVAEREAQEKRNVAAEREKVSEQNRNLRLLLESFESLTEDALVSEDDLFERASLAVQRMTGADKVVFRALPLQGDPGSASHLYCPGSGASGNLLCLSRRPHAFSESQLEWCALLQDFLDKTIENGNLHREVQASQQEIVVSSQWAAAGRLAANAAHELNTPLGAVRIAAEHITLYLKHGGKVEPALESMESLMNSVDKCRKVTDRLLLTSRPVDAGAQPLKPEVQDAAAIIKDAVASVTPFLRAAKIKLELPQPLPAVPVLVVMQDLYWALVNVMKNSVDAINDANSPDKRLFISLQRREQQLAIVLRDTGTGLSAEARTNLFEPFYTSKKLGQGNGLGLSMSRTNLRRWGGDLEHQDSPEGGATFVLKIPLA